MSDLTVITPPDKIHNNEYSILLINPSNFLKESLQNAIVDVKKHLNIYLYQQQTNTDDPEWLLEIFALCDIVIMDVDNSSPSIRNLTSYFISKNKTYWLTNSGDNVYNLISKNRIYDLDFIKTKIGE